MTVIEFPICKCGHAQRYHTAQYLHGALWAFGSCFVAACKCDKFEAAQPQPEPAKKLTDMLEPRLHAAAPSDCKHNLLNSTGICAECGQPQPEPAHPEDLCNDCGQPNPVWFAPNDLWNKVIPERVGIICPNCFIRRAESAGVKCTGWELRPDNQGGERVEGEGPIKEIREWAVLIHHGKYHQWKDFGACTDKGCQRRREVLKRLESQ